MVNSNLQKMEAKFGLSQKVCIYIPSTIDVDKTINNALYVKNTQIELVGLFGGATTVNNCVGSWYSDDLGKTVNENVTMVYSNTDLQNLEKHIAEVWNYAYKLCKLMRQECISLEINGKLYFVDSEF